MVTTNIFARPNVFGRRWHVAYSHPATRGIALRARVAAFHHAYWLSLPPVLDLGQLAIQKDGLRLLARIILNDLQK